MSSTPRRRPHPLSYCITFHLGGAVSRVGQDETAFGQRNAVHNVNINAVWTTDDEERERHVEWARQFHAALEPFDRVYVNFLGDESTVRVRSAFGDEKYERLAALKERWDPGNFFRHNRARADSAFAPGTFTNPRSAS